MNEDNVPLYTSDNPVVFWCEQEPFDGAPKLANTIFGAPGTCLSFPVTPQLLILLYERTAFTKLAPGDGRFEMCSAEYINFLNSIQVLASYRQVFCQVNAFNPAEEMCTATPDLCDPDARIRAFLNAPLLNTSTPGCMVDVMGMPTLAAGFSAFLPHVEVKCEAEVPKEMHCMLES